jgi:hypothetical protein
VSRGPAIYGWENTVVMVDEVLAARLLGDPAQEQL